MLINKLIEILKNSERYCVHELNSKESRDKYSYYYGRLSQIEEIVEWIDSLPKASEIDEAIKRIEENNCIDTYTYCGFNYHELKKLKELL